MCTGGKMYIETWVRELINGLENEQRWKGHNATFENVLQHAFKMSWVAQIMIAFERRYGDLSDLRPYVILQAAVNHDIGEAIVGDVLLPNKTEEDEVKEKQAYQKLVAQVIPEEIREHIPLPPDVAPEEEFSKREIEFWDVCEKIGYVLFMGEELRNNHPTLGENYHEWKKWLEDFTHFPGVMFFLDHFNHHVNA